jgi:hypothetical protein
LGSQKIEKLPKKQGLPGRYNAAGTKAWHNSLIAGLAFDGTLLGLNARWYWLASLITGLLFVHVFELKLYDIERNHEL